MKTNFLSIVFFSIIAAGFVACEGEQGEIGPNGIKGDQGNIGNTGANGEGFEELTKYGKIAVTFSGTRSDDEEFTETLDFIYLPTSGISENSSFYKYENGTMEFLIGRENKGSVNKTGRTEGGGMKNNVWIDVVKTSDGISLDQLVIYTDVITDDFKTFEINFNNGSWDEGFEAAITNYSYDAATGKLKFDFSYTIPNFNSSTGFEINVTGTADLIVFEKLDIPA
jgi:hypothetical protein